MTPHRFDPISGGFGALVVFAGLAVATDSTSQLLDGGGWWITIGVLVLGLAIAGSALRRVIETPGPND